MSGSCCSKSAAVSDASIVRIFREVKDVVRARVIHPRFVDAFNPHQRHATPMQACRFTLYVVEVVQYLEFVVA
jgi:hypothetical protein